ncbi:MAG TPA: M23 family peptidase, partial [Acetobacteraceae bacterium]|nr:M23 family peptidase [Acetobacteraceae bacterium]
MSPYRMLPRRLALAAPALVLARPTHAAVEIANGLAQGGFVSGRAAPGTRLALDGRAVRVSSAGFFAFGFGRDHGPESSLVITHPNGRGETQRLAIARRSWNVQHITGLPPAQVTPDPDALARIQRERERLGQARATDSARTDFAGGFQWPARGRISGVYGSQRILNGQPRAPHWGVDIAAPAGTPVVATA